MAVSKPARLPLPDGLLRILQFLLGLKMFNQQEQRIQQRFILLQPTRFFQLRQQTVISLQSMVLMEQQQE